MAVCGTSSTESFDLSSACSLDQQNRNFGQKRTLPEEAQIISMLKREAFGSKLRDRSSLAAQEQACAGQRS